MFINRRQVLKNMTLGASSLALTPLLQQLQAQERKGELPKRFVFFVKGNGYYPDDIQPKSVKHTPDKKQMLKLSSLKLSECMEPLRRHLDHTTLIRGLSNKAAKGGHSGFYGGLGCYYTNGMTQTTGTPPEDVTIDCLMGKHFPSIFNNLGFFANDGQPLSRPAFISAIRPRLQLPFFDNTELTYKYLFGSVLSGDFKIEANLKEDLLDFMVADVNKFSKQLSGYQKEKMNLYVENFEIMKARNRKIKENREVIRKFVPGIDERYKENKFEVVHNQKLHLEMGTAALISGMTNVLTFRTCDLTTRYKGIGIPGDCHSIGHGRDVGTKTTEEARLFIRRHHFTMMAELADRLKKIPEGNGTMLDNTVIMHLSDGGYAHHGDTREAVRVILGGKNIIKNEGKYIQYPAYGQSGNRTIGSLYLAMLHNVKKPQKQFGRIDTSLDKTIDQNLPLEDLIT